MSEGTGPALSREELHALEAILAKLSGRGAGLPAPLFRFVTEVSATANVDLLVRDRQRGILLAWREDAFGAGWHVPGSIIRHREEIAHRVSACARDEFGCEATVAAGPVAVIQIFDGRGHTISLCFPTTLLGEPGRRVVAAGEAPAVGDLCWFPSLPERLYPSHRVYRELLDALDHGRLGEGAPLFTQHAGAQDAERASPEGGIDAAPLA